MLKPTTLKNGLTVLKFPRTQSNIVTVGFVVPSGSSQENGSFPQGISSLVQRLFWCGTDKHPSTKSLNTAIESIGGDLTSFCNQEMTEYYLTVPKYHQYKAVSILAEIIQHSYCDQKDVLREKHTVIEEIKSFDQNLDNIFTELALSNLYYNHPLGLPVKGSIESAMMINAEVVKDFLAHQYRPDACFFIVAGNFDNKNISELVEQEWGYWSPRQKPFVEAEKFSLEDAGEMPRVIYRQRGMSHTHLVVSFILDHGLLHPQLITASTDNSEEPKHVDIYKITDEYLTQCAEILVLNTLLGQGSSSRLWSKTVDDEMFFTSIQSEIINFKYTGHLQISGLCDNSQFTFALESILSCLEALKKTTVSINELAKAKEYLKGRLYMTHEELKYEVAWYIEQMVGTELTFSLEDLISKINRVDAASVRARADYLFVPSKLTITTLGTAKETRLVDKLIHKYIGSQY